MNVTWVCGFAKQKRSKDIEGVWKGTMVLSGHGISASMESITTWRQWARGTVKYWTTVGCRSWEGRES